MNILGLGGVTGSVRGDGAPAGATERHTSLQELDAEIAEVRVDLDGVATGHVSLHAAGGGFVTSVAGVASVSGSAKRDRAPTASEDGVTSVPECDAEI